MVRWSGFSFHWLVSDLPRTGQGEYRTRTRGHIFEGFYKTFSSISHYSTASTSNAAYIIGGRYTSDVIAEFKASQWRRLGNLFKERIIFQSRDLSRLESFEHIIRKCSEWNPKKGVNDMRRLHLMTRSWSLADSQLIQGNFSKDWHFTAICCIYSDAETEIWDTTNEKGSLIDFSLPHAKFIHGVALYIVDFDFCTK